MMDLFLCPHFPYSLDPENDPQKQQATHEERKQQNTITQKARAESALKRQKSTCQVMLKRLSKTNPPQAPFCISTAKKPFLRLLCD